MNVKRLRAETWEAINRVILQFACTRRIESGQKVRVDTTTVETNIHEPSDSSLLWDCVRVVTRLLHRVADDLPAAHVPFTDHTRRAKRRAYALKFPPRGTRREGHLRWAYGDLLKVTKNVLGYGQATCARLDAIADTTGAEALRARGVAAELTGFVNSMARVISQTERRVFHGEKVPTADKLLSIFETHTTVVVKGESDVVFGHKVCLTWGRCIRRHVDLYGVAPRQTSFDGGFASRANLHVAKALGVQDVAFHKKCGLTIPDMVSSASVFRTLVRFRTGIEGCISALKRGYGMNRCSWRQWPSFRSYVWASVVSFNLVSLARRLLA